MAGFYSACGRIIPLRPWPTFPPPRLTSREGLAFQRLGRLEEERIAYSKALATDPACYEARLFSLVRSIPNQAALPGLGTFRVASQFLSVKLEELTTPKKISAPSKTTDPKEQPVRPSEDQVAPAEPDDRQHPPRDTRETPAPNPNDKGLPNRALNKSETEG